MTVDACGRSCGSSGDGRNNGRLLLRPACSPPGLVRINERLARFLVCRSNPVRRALTLLSTSARPTRILRVTIAAAVCTVDARADDERIGDVRMFRILAKGDLPPAALNSFEGRDCRRITIICLSEMLPPTRATSPLSLVKVSRRSRASPASRSDVRLNLVVSAVHIAKAVSIGSSPSNSSAVGVRLVKGLVCETPAAAAAGCGPRVGATGRVMSPVRYSRSPRPRTMETMFLSNKDQLSPSPSCLSSGRIVMAGMEVDMGNGVWGESVSGVV